MADKPEKSSLLLDPARMWEWAGAGANSGRGVVLVHVGYGAAAAYEQAHLPGAIYLDTLQLESPVALRQAQGAWDRRPRADVRALCLSLGIRAETSVVLYGKEAVPGEGQGRLAAFRAAMILMDAGVADVRVLDGGFAAWVRAGLPVEAGGVAPRPAVDSGVFAARGVFIDTADVRRILRDPGRQLVDVRSRAEYDGETSGYDYFDARGRIPGAIWGGESYAAPGGEMRPLAEIDASWTEKGIAPDRPVVFYCGTGWRAAEAWYAARLLGWEAVVYDGGWYAWSMATGGRVAGS